MRFVGFWFAGVALIAAASAPPSSGAQGRPIRFDDFSAVRHVSDPHVSPDGRLVLYSVRTVNPSIGRRIARAWMVPVDGSTSPRAFPDDTTPATDARFSPDGRRVAYVHRGQLWVAAIDGSNRRQLTRLWGGASGPKWAPGGDRIAFTSSVYPACVTDQCNADSALRMDRRTNNVRIYNQLLYRHWDSWDDGTRAHLFVVDIARAEPRDLMARSRMHVPPMPFSGPESYDWSHDAQELTFSARVERPEAAWTTDLNLFTVSAFSGEPRAITSANRAADAHPVYSRNGRWIAYASQRRPGFEADRWRIMLYDRQNRTSREIAPDWDYSAERFYFTPGNRALIMEAQESGKTVIWRIPLDEEGFAEGAPERIVNTLNSSQSSLAFQFGTEGGITLVWVRDAMHQTPDIWTGRYSAAGVTGKRALTRENANLLAQLDLKPAEEVRFTQTSEPPVHGFLVRPPAFDSTQSWPLVMLVHGGPQGAWLNHWNTRWNAQMFAATGAVVLALNPRGSTGYGQRYTDEVSRDWGGKVYSDLIRGLDAALERYPWLDSSRVAVAGGSFGGYMANWMNANTNRFSAFIAHAGIFNLEHMSGTTDELWFTEWEFGGVWWQRSVMQNQRRFSPHVLAGRMSTPTLILHGEQDFRVPYTEGTALFTALQRQRVPSKLVLFPDEGHWINRPANQEIWWGEVQSWLDKWVVNPS